MFKIGLESPNNNTIDNMSIICYNTPQKVGFGIKPARNLKNKVVLKGTLTNEK